VQGHSISFEFDIINIIITKLFAFQPWTRIVAYL